MTAIGKIAKATVVCLLALVMVACFTGCYHPTSQKRTATNSPAAQTAPAANTTSKHKTYSDIPTPYPDLYVHNRDSGWLNTYDESKVINYSDAYNYVGQAVTVEGVPTSVVYAGSTNGTPHFFNMGGEAYAPGGFAIVIWGQDLAKFDQLTLRNFVEWSMSDQPITARFRVSGVVEMYNGRPQITARDGSQIAMQMDNGSWITMMSDDSVNALMDAIYN